MELPQTSPQARDPVCGMTVNREAASAAGLAVEHEGETYCFCGRGCRLEFLDDPKHFLDPGYQPHM